MRVVLHREGQPISASDFERDYGLSISDAIIHKLVTGNLDIVASRFVGWWSSRGKVCLSLPKVFPEPPSAGQIRSFASALRRYCTSGVAFFEHGTNLLRGVEDLPFLFDRLSEHTERFGWHSKDAWYDSDLIDYADWARTAVDFVGVGPPESLVFVESVGARSSVSAGEMRSLQARALVELWDGMADILLNPESRYISIVDDARSLLNDLEQPFSPEEIVLEHLDANRDHDRGLAEILGEWLGIRSEAKSHNSFNGTTSFEHVWEEMVRSAIAAAQDCDLVKHVEIASQPTYRDAFGNYMFSTGNQRPDVIARYADRLMIFDAKWYPCDGYPGTDDVVKQVAYVKTAREEVSVNAFVFPKVGGTPEILGSCSFEFEDGRDERFAPILLIAIPVVELLDAYAGRKESEIGQAILDLVS